MSAAVTPSLLPELQERLARAFDRPGVVSATIIGSQARGEARPESDLDLAVWVEPTLAPSAALALASELLHDAGAIVHPRAVDLVDLGRAHPVLRHRALRDGVRLVERDHAARVRLERDALVDYWDTEPLRKLHAEALRRRLAEDRFGRP